MTRRRERPDRGYWRADTCVGAGPSIAAMEVIDWLLEVTRPSGGRCCATSLRRLPTRSQPSAPASRPTGGEPACSPCETQPAGGTAAHAPAAHRRRLAGRHRTGLPRRPAELGDRDVDRADAGVEVAVPVAVAGVDPLRGPVVGGGPAQTASASAPSSALTNVAKSSRIRPGEACASWSCRNSPGSSVLVRAGSIPGVAVIAVSFFESVVERSLEGFTRWPRLRCRHALTRACRAPLCWTQLRLDGEDIQGPGGPSVTSSCRTVRRSMPGLDQHYAVVVGADSYDGAGGRHGRLNGGTGLRCGIAAAIEKVASRPQ